MLFAPYYGSQGSESRHKTILHKAINTKRRQRRTATHGAVRDHTYGYHAAVPGAKMLVLVGQRKALAIAVRNNRTKQRFSGLLARLNELSKSIR